LKKRSKEEELEKTGEGESVEENKGGNEGENEEEDNGREIHCWMMAVLAFSTKLEGFRIKSYWHIISVGALLFNRVIFYLL
jgi:hypothetical protein